jgi:hypothetical protein
LSDAFTVTATTIQTSASTGMVLSSNSGSFTSTLLNMTNPGAYGCQIIDQTGVVAISGGILSGAINSALFVNGGNANVGFGPELINTSGRSVEITNRTGGVLTVSGSLNDTGLGVLLQNNSSGATQFTNPIKILNTGANQAISLLTNTGHTIAFTGGGLGATTSGNANAFVASGGGTVTVEGAGNTLLSGSGAALFVENTTIGAAGLTFQSITAGQATGSNGLGIALINTGSSGGLTVTGFGSTPGSGGTIQHKTGSDNSTTNGLGIFLDRTSNTSLSYMQLNDFDNFAIRGTMVTGFALNHSVINGVNGNSAAFDEGAISFSNLLGSVNMSSNTISGGHEDNLRVLNDTGILNRMTVSGGTIGLNSSVSGNDGILVEASSNATANVTVTGVSFSGARGDMFQANAIDTATMDVVLQNNTFHNTHPNIVSGGGGITLSGGGASSNFTMTYDISGTPAGTQSFSGANGNAITVNFVSGSGTATGTISNNDIGTAGVPGSGSLYGNGIMVGASDAVQHTSTIDANSIRGINGFGGIDIVANVNVPMNVTLTNNVVAEMGGFSFAALTSLFGGNGNETGTLCLDIQDNTFNASGASFAGNAVYLDQVSSLGHYNLPGYSGSGNGEFTPCGAAGTASADIHTALLSLGNLMTNGAAPSQPGGVDASLLCGVTGSGVGCP